MFHSAPVSEPIALVGGIAAGLGGGYAAHALGAAHNIEVWTAVGASVLFSVIVGAKINLMTLDLLSLVVARPITAATVGAVAGTVINAFLKG